MADDVGEGDGNEEGQEDVVNLGSLSACAVQADCEKADGDVEKLAGDFMAVDLSELVVGLYKSQHVRTNDRHF